MYINAFYSLAAKLATDKDMCKDIYDFYVERGSKNDAVKAWRETIYYRTAFIISIAIHDVANDKMKNVIATQIMQRVYDRISFREKIPFWSCGATKDELIKKVEWYVNTHEAWLHSGGQGYWWESSLMEILPEVKQPLPKVRLSTKVMYMTGNVENEVTTFLETDHEKESLEKYKALCYGLIMLILLFFFDWIKSKFR